MPIHREIRQTVNEAVERGWTFSMTKGHHVKMQWKDGSIVFTASTPSDWRSVRNFKANLRRIEKKDDG